MSDRVTGGWLDQAWHGYGRVREMEGGSRQGASGVTRNGGPDYPLGRMLFQGAEIPIRLLLDHLGQQQQGDEVGDGHEAIGQVGEIPDEVARYSMAFSP